MRFTPSLRLNQIIPKLCNTKCVIQSAYHKMYKLYTWRHYIKWKYQFDTIKAFCIINSINLILMHHNESSSKLLSKFNNLLVNAKQMSKTVHILDVELVFWSINVDYSFNLVYWSQWLITNYFVYKVIDHTLLSTTLLTHVC